MNEWTEKESNTSACFTRVNLPAKVRPNVATRKTRRGPGALGTRVGSIHAGGAQGDRWQPTESRTTVPTVASYALIQSTPPELVVFSATLFYYKGANDQHALFALRRSARKSTDVPPNRPPHPDAADNPLWWCFPLFLAFLLLFPSHYSILLLSFLLLFLSRRSFFYFDRHCSFLLFFFNYYCPLSRWFFP